MAVDRPGRSPNRPEPKQDRREISRNRLPTQTPQAGRQDRSAASCDDRRRRNPVVRPSIHPKPSKVMESEIRENHQVFRRVQLAAAIAAAGGDVANIVFITSPAQGFAVGLQPRSADLKIWPSRALAAGTIVAIKTSAFVSAFGALPRVEASIESVAHMEDSAPLD